MCAVSNSPGDNQFRLVAVFPDRLARSPGVHSEPRTHVCRAHHHKALTPFQPLARPNMVCPRKKLRHAPTIVSTPRAASYFYSELKERLMPRTCHPPFLCSRLGYFASRELRAVFSETAACTPLAVA